MKSGPAPDEDKAPSAVDVLILGAGPAGSATALALRRAGVPRVLLLDKASRLPFALGESASPGVPSLLRRLGLEQPLEKLGHLPYYGNLSLWGGDEPLADDFLRHGLPHGFHLDRKAFDIWLREQAHEAGAMLLSPVELQLAQRAERSFCVQFHYKGQVQQIKSTIVVDATGRKAAFARRMGAGVHKLDRLIALAVLAEPAHQSPISLAGLSMVEAFGDGWWYAAGLPSGRCIVTLMSDDDIAREAQFRDPTCYKRALSQTLQLRRALQMPSKEDFEVLMVPANTQYIDRALGTGWIAVGDALISFDPLTSSGIAGALDDALAAADTIVAWFSAKDGTQAAQAARAYVERADATLRRYLSEHRAWYARERRFGERPFWQRRAGLKT